MDRRQSIGTASAAITFGSSPLTGAPTLAAVPEEGGRDAAIIDAWNRRVAAHAMISGGEVDGRDAALAPYWAIVDECDKLIHTTQATTPKGVAVQIWTALHNSSAYVRDEEQAILRMDLEYLTAHAGSFDWDARSLVAALRSLQAMGA